MRRYEKQEDFLNVSLVEGELIRYNNKVCKVTISRVGPLQKPREVVVLTPLHQVTITEDTEIIMPK